MDENISQLVKKIAKLIKLSDEKLKEMANPDSLMDENQKKLDAAQNQENPNEPTISHVKLQIIQNVQQTYR